MQAVPIPKNEAQRLASLHSLNILDTAPEERFDRLTRLAQRLFDMPIALISLIDSERQWFKSCQGLSMPETKREVSFCTHTIQEPKVLIVPDTWRDERFVDNPLVTENPHIRFYAGVPLQTRDGNPVGTLCLIDRKPREFGDDEIESLKDVATLVENELNLTEIGQIQQQLHLTNQALQQEIADHQETSKHLRLTQLSIDHAADAIFWVGMSGQFSHVNDAACRYLGYSRQELLGLSLPDIDPNYSADRWASHWAAIKERESFTVESYHTTKDGRTVPVEMAFNYLEFDGNAYNYIFVRDITWRRWAAEELRESEERFHQVVSSIPDFVYMTEIPASEPPRNQYISSKVEALTGYPVLEFVTDWRFWQSLIHPEDIEGALAHFDNFKAGQASETEYRLIRADGEIIWIRDGGYIKRDEFSQNLVVYGVARDVTAPKLAEEAIKQQEAFLRQVLDINPHLIFARDRSGHFTLANEAFAKMYNCNVVEILGKSDTDLHLPKKLIAQSRQDDLAVMTNLEEMFIPEREITTLNQEVRWWQIIKRPIINSDGVANQVLGIVTDITERKLAEAALKASEERLRHVIASISGHIYVTELSKTGAEINNYISPNVEALTGYPMEEFINNWHFWQSLIHPEDQATAARQVKRFVQGLDSEVEYRLIQANGEIIWVQDSGRVQKSKRDSILTIYGVVTDITEYKQVEEALRTARDQALEANRLKTELLAKVSHELRTPLTAIIGFAEMLNFGIYGEIESDQKEAITEIIDSGQYLKSLVNELLDQAQMDSGKMKLNLSSFSPTDLIKDTQSKMKVLAQNKGLKLLTEIDGGIPETLSGDPARIQQIVVNLVSNAIKFTREGQVCIRLFCTDSRQWAVQVTDTGLGIPAEAQKHIFEPFQQVDGSVTREFAGSGLGLSIVKQLTMLMGGEISLESSMGQGSTFTVKLPLSPGQEQ